MTHQFLNISLPKLFVGILVFMLAMMVTFSAAYGVNVPPQNTDNSVTDNSTNNTAPMARMDDSKERETISTVPEPTTLILLASGLGIMRIVHLRRKKA